MLKVQILERGTAWLDTGVEPYPRATADNYLYQQEFGFDADGSPMENVYIQSSDFDIGDGENFQFVRRHIPDFKFLQNDNNGSINIVLQTRDFPGNTLSTASTSSIQDNTGQVHIRARGRQAALRFESDDDATNDGNLGIGWRLGATRIDIRQDGRR